MENKLRCMVFLPIEFEIWKDGDELLICSITLPTGKDVEQELKKKDTFGIYEILANGNFKQIPNPFHTPTES